jgi:4-amino-4-deoxy-L-arabinose transferase-like glycosyltransferase
MPVSKKLLALFFLAFILRVLFFVLAISNAASPETYILRFDGYYDIARNILSGNGFSQDAVAPFEPDSIRTPLYPLFLAFFAMLFGVFDAAIIPQIVVGSCIPLLAYRIARQLMGSEYVALWTAALLAVEPLSITFSSTFQVETLFTALLLSGLTVFLAYLQTERVHVLAASMVLLGFAVLARPTVQFLPLILVGVILFQLRGNPRRALGHSILLICIGGAVVSPWLLRNYLQFGAVSLSVQSVSVPYAFLVPSAIALEKKQGFSKTQDEFNRGIGNIKDVEDITLANMGEYKKRLPGLLLAHPVGFMKSVGVTALTFFTHDGYLDVLARLHLDPKVRLERPAFITFMERPKEALVLVASLA